jgi:hypothetical protein
MRTPDAVRRTIDFLCRPCIQRLSTLVISTLLAMSLILTISVIALPLVEREVASSTPVAYPGAVHVQDFVPQIRTHGQVSAQRVEHHETERRHV